MLRCDLIGTVDPNDDTKARNNVSCNPSPNDLVPPQNHPPNDSLPYQNRPRIEDLTYEDLIELRVLQTTYNNILALAPMPSTLNIIVDNIERLINEQKVSLHWHEIMHSMLDDGFNHGEVMALNITKDDIVSLFANPNIDKLVECMQNPNYQLHGAQMRLYMQTFGIIGRWFIKNLHIVV